MSWKSRTFAVMEQIDYESFDRQMEVLVNGTHALVEEWDDIMTIEMTMDLKSLCLKASRLCALADIDMAMQQQDIAHLRTQQNIMWHDAMDSVMRLKLTALIRKVVDRIKATGKMEGHRSPMFPGNVVQVLPRITELIMDDSDEPDRAKWQTLIDSTVEAEKLLHRILKPTVFPGMDHKERFWMLYELFAMECYLLLHFRNVDALCRNAVESEDAGSRLRMIINRYATCYDGERELERYIRMLEYDNDGMLTVPVLENARKGLLRKVPESLQLCFMDNMDDLDGMAREIATMGISADEYAAFIDVLAKWQLLEQEIYDLTAAKTVGKELYNEVFSTMMFNRPVKLCELKERITGMLKYVTRKNHWFCVWSVLRKHGCLRSESFSAFAQQMMHEDWFGRNPKVLKFSADTLNEYSGYFTDFPYNLWNQKSYDDYRQIHGKKKWGKSLCAGFIDICCRMDMEYEGV